MPNTKSPFFTQQVSASVPSSSNTVHSLECTSVFVLHKDTSIDSCLPLTSYYPQVRRKTTASLWFCPKSLAWVPLWLGTCFGFADFHRHLFIFLLVLFQRHFAEHLLVATSRRRQLQAFLFHNYCDHPCRMAQLNEQLGQINQSLEIRAGGNCTVRRNFTVLSTTDWSFRAVRSVAQVQASLRAKRVWNMQVRRFIWCWLMEGSYFPDYFTQLN